MDAKKFKFLRDDYTNKPKPLRPISTGIKTENSSLSPINNKRHISKGYSYHKYSNEEFPNINHTNKIQKTPSKSPMKGSLKTRDPSKDLVGVDKESLVQENTLLRSHVKKLKSDLNSYKAEIMKLSQDLAVRDKIVQEMMGDKDKSVFIESTSYLQGSPVKNREVR
jgi:hypothetical protein